MNQVRKLVIIQKISCYIRILEGIKVNASEKKSSSHCFTLSWKTVIKTSHWIYFSTICSTITKGMCIFRVPTHCTCIYEIVYFCKLPKQRLFQRNDDFMKCYANNKQFPDYCNVFSLQHIAISWDARMEYRNEEEKKKEKKKTKIKLHCNVYTKCTSNSNLMQYLQCFFLICHRS